MLNAFTHYDFHDKVRGYLEFHFSNNRVDQQLAATNINGPFLLNIDNPYLNPQMREVLRQLDLRETGPTSVAAGTLTLQNRPNDGLAAINIGRRLVEVPLRRNVSDRNVWRTAIGARGDLGEATWNRVDVNRLGIFALEPEQNRCIAAMALAGVTQTAKQLDFHRGHRIGMAGPDDVLGEPTRGAHRSSD